MSLNDSECTSRVPCELGVLIGIHLPVTTWALHESYLVQERRLLGFSTLRKQLGEVFLPISQQMFGCNILKGNSYTRTHREYDLFFLACSRQMAMEAILSDIYHQVWEKILPYTKRRDIMKSQKMVPHLANLTWCWCKWHRDSPCLLHKSPFLLLVLFILYIYSHI